MKQPMISICIPAYNNEGFIKETIESILNQTYKNFELIVVDDKSRDNTVKVVEEIKDARIKLFKNEKNLGMVGNWNRCLELANGEYVKLICADDILYPDCVAKEVKVLEHYPNVNMVVSNTALVNNDGKKTGEFRRYFKKGVVKGKEVVKMSLLIQNFFGAPVNTMFRKKALEKSGKFDIDFTYILDFDLWIRIAALGDIYILKETLNGFRIRNDSNTGMLINTKQDVYVDEHKRLLEKYMRLETVKFTKFDYKLSIFIRKIRNRMINVYLKCFAK